MTTVDEMLGKNLSPACKAYLADKKEWSELTTQEQAEYRRRRDNIDEITKLLQDCIADPEEKPQKKLYHPRF